VGAQAGKSTPPACLTAHRTAWRRRQEGRAGTCLPGGMGEEPCGALSTGSSHSAFSCEWPHGRGCSSGGALRHTYLLFTTLQTTCRAGPHASRLHGQSLGHLEQERRRLRLALATAVDDVEGRRGGRRRRCGGGARSARTTGAATAPVRARRIPAGGSSTSSSSASSRWA